MDYQKLQNGSDIRGVALGDGANLTEAAARDLAAAFVKWLSARGNAQPKIAIGENVRGLERHDGGRTLKTMLAALAEMKEIALPAPTVTIRSAVSQETVEALNTLADALAARG